MAQLHEDYRPREWADVVGQDAAVAAVQAVLKRGWGGRAWWITGASGTGKTTLARLIAAAGADEFGTEEVDAGTLTPNRLADIERAMQYRALSGKPGKAFLVNEAHGLRRDTIRRLLVLLESLPEHVAFIFTTTVAGQAELWDDCQDTAPLLSRCIEVELSNGDRARQAMAKRAKEIAQREGIDGLPDAVYLSALDAVQGNMRRLLQRIECGGFAKDAERRRLLQVELDHLRSTKGERAEKRREELKALLAC